MMPIQRCFVLQRPGGEDCLIEFSTSPIFANNGSVVEYAFIFRDVLSEKKQEDAVSWQATHDPLNQILNRNPIIVAIKGPVITARQYHVQHIMLFIDLDDFKLVNDQFKNTAGDELLIGMCREMEECVPKGDHIARMGGDEFAMVV